MKPTFVVASQDFEKDLSIIKEILSQLASKYNFQDGYNFSESSEKAAGWWFYEIYLKPDFLKKIIDTVTQEGKKNKDDRGILEVIQNKLKTGGSTGRIRLYKDKPFLIRWWKWLLK